MGKHKSLSMGKHKSLSMCTKCKCVGSFCMFRITMKKFHMWLSRKVLFYVEIGLCRTNVTFSDAKVPENEIRYITGFHFLAENEIRYITGFHFWLQNDRHKERPGTWDTALFTQNC